MIVGFWYRFWGLSFMTVDQKAQVANAREEQQMSNENDEQNRAEVAAPSPTADDYVRATALAVGVDPDEAVAYRRATDRTQPAGEHHTGTLDLTGEGNAPGSPISDAVVDAAERTFWGLYGTEESFVVITSSYAMRKTLEAAYPAIRQQVAEEIAAAIEARCIDAEWPDDAISRNGELAAATARQIGGRA